jgi:prepilin-type N-terminal cleavage/methylation domain-containing protein
VKIVNKKQGGFTLLELLIVVGIMAIIGGAMIGANAGQEQKAARGAATQSIAGIENAVSVYQAMNGVLPSNLETLACLPYDAAYDVAKYTALTVSNDALARTAAASATTAFPLGGVSNVAGIGGGLGKKLKDKLTLTAITSGQADALIDAGITEVRYAAAEGCDNDASTVVASITIGQDAVGADIVSTNVGAKGLETMSIPYHAFEAPRAGDKKNRGIGFSAPVAEKAPLMFWGTGYNTMKVGGGDKDQLIALGVGQASDLVGNGKPLLKAPFYGQVGKDKYAHFIALVNVGPAGSEFDGGAAYVQAVVDARGDFLDEEMAEFTGQKK